MSFAVVVAFVSMLVLLFMRVPVFVSVMGASAAYFILTPGITSRILVQRMIAGSENVALLAIVFFVCAGIFMGCSGVTKRLMNFCDILVGGFVGGLGQVSVLLATLMGGISGSSYADAAMQSKMIVPEMVKRGFSLEFSSVITAMAAIITPLIPPGIALIIYGSIANISIGKLFVAGFGPGILLCILLMIMVSIISHKRNYKATRTEPITAQAFLSALRGAIPVLILPIVIIGGIRLGVFTPTEAGVVAIMYSIVLGLYYRELTWNIFLEGIKETVIASSSIMMIIAAASAFSWILTKEMVPQYFTQMVLTYITEPWQFLVIVNIFLLIVGMFLEGNAALIILIPLFAPIAAQLGIDPIHFAMVFIFNMAVGSITPPMGMLMFITCSVTKCKTGAFIKEAVPFYVLLLFAIIVMTTVPACSIGVVNLFY